MKLNEQWMQKTIVVWIGALLCCALWHWCWSAWEFILYITEKKKRETGG